ncbi:MAG: peptidylprolyl isomerase [Candidatus Kapabacteria bacterium]|nr:peptidylprolyl isomerase [Ignavibacteriota bacterium]MCW5885408.1 peptidylprolyl isomerase [Candidatus Kapabacteria bacterium]
MGTLQQIRRVSPYVFGIFAVLLVAFFTIGDPTVIEGLRGSSGSPTSQVLAEINGDEILYVDYETRVRDEIENMKRQNQDVTDDKTIRQRVWDQMVDEILLRQQMDKYGITISDAQVREQMLDNPPDYLANMFRDSAGNFMRDVYVELITSPQSYVNYLGADPSQIPIEEREAAVNNFRKDLMNIEKYLRQNLATNELQSAVGTATGFISPAFAKLKYTEENSIADIKFIAVTTKDVPQEAMEIKKEDIEKFYNENKHLFKQKAQRRLKYVTFNMLPSSDDSSKYIQRVTNILDDLESVEDDDSRDSIFDLYLSKYGGINNEYKMVQDIDPNVYQYLAILGNKKIAGPIQRPDGTYFFRVDDRRMGENEMVKASHILFRTGEGINTDSARNEALKVLKKAKVDKEPFAILATTHSEDNGSAPKGGDLGYFGRGMMVPAFDSAAFAGKVGDILGPIKSDFGFHLIYIEDKRSEDLKYSEIRLSPLMSTASKNKIIRDAISIQKQVQEGTPFDTVVARLGLSPQLSPFFETGKSILGSRYIVDHSFKLKLGDVLEPLELERYGVVVAVLNDVKETGFKPLDDVRTEISQRLGKKRLLEMAKEKSQQLYSQVSVAGSLDSVAEMMPELADKVMDLPMFKPSPSVPGVGSDAVFSPKVFSLPENKINEPFKGENAYYIVEVKNRNFPAEEKIKEELNDYMLQLTQQSKGSAFFQWFQNIKETAKIKDKRSMFYKEY